MYLHNISDNIIKDFSTNTFPSYVDPLALALAGVCSLLGGVIITLAAAFYFCKRY